MSNPRNRTSEVNQNDHSNPLANPSMQRLQPNANDQREGRKKGNSGPQHIHLTQSIPLIEL